MVLLPSALVALLASHLTSASPIVSRQTTFDNCLSDASLSPVTMSSSSYSDLTRAFNQRLQPSPIALITPSTPSQISSAIKCASAVGVPVQARSGGHSYASFGLGGVDEEALIIDLKKFKNVQVWESGSAVVGAGNLLGDVAIKLNEKGRGLPHGVCPFVGIGGHASMGGFGYAGRWKGLTVDTITALDAVLANGTIVSSLTANKDPDLFWALAGSAPSFGIVTSFHFATFEAPPTAIVFSYNYLGLSVSDQVDAFSAYQSFGAASAPAELGISFTIGAGGSIDISGVYYGAEQEFNSYINVLLDKLPEGYETLVTAMSWIESLQSLAGDQNLDTSGGSDSRDSFYAKSLMTPFSNLLTDEALTDFFNYLKNTETDTNWFVEVNLYGGKNSFIDTVSLQTNSFGHRNKLLTFQMYASSSTYGNPYPSSGVDFVQGMYDALVNPMLPTWEGDDAYGAYVNYVDPNLSATEAKELYWSTQYERLATLKKRYDPKGVFKNAQTIVAA